MSREPHNGDLKKIKRDIKRARNYARIHFNEYVNEKETPSHLLAHFTCKLEFPSPDTMVVGVICYQQLVPSSLVTYRLWWDDDDKPHWKGRFLYGPVKVGDLAIPDSLEGLSKPVYNEEETLARVSLGKPKVD